MLLYNHLSVRRQQNDRRENWVRIEEDQSYGMNEGRKLFREIWELEEKYIMNVKERNI